MGVEQIKHHTGPIQWSKLVETRLAALEWTSYRLAKELEGKVTAPTVYNFMAGKPVKSDTLAIILAAVDITVITAANAKGGRK
jgi:hypothetical protein